MSDSKPVYEEKRVGFRLTVWPTRVETSEGTFVPKVNTYPIKSITGVTVAGMTRKLQITTQDGKPHQYQLAHPERAVAAILELQSASDAPASSAAPAADPIAQLERLAKLKESGALTDEEFQSQKAKLLGA